MSPWDEEAHPYPTDPEVSSSSDDNDAADAPASVLTTAAFYAHLAETYPLLGVAHIELYYTMQWTVL